MDLFIFLFFVFVFGGWVIGKITGIILLPKNDEYNSKYVDKSIHHHHHTHYHTHQNLTVIDEETHKKGLNIFDK